MKYSNNEKTLIFTLIGILIFIIIYGYSKSYVIKEKTETIKTEIFVESELKYEQCIEKNKELNNENNTLRQEILYEKVLKALEIKDYKRK